MVTSPKRERERKRKRKGKGNRERKGGIGRFGIGRRNRARFSFLHKVHPPLK